MSRSSGIFRTDRQTDRQTDGRTRANPQDLTSSVGPKTVNQPLGFQFLGQKMANFSNFSNSFQICLETIEIHYLSKFWVIWIIFWGFMAILAEYFSPFFIWANIKEFAISNFYKKCMQILNFDRNWLIFCTKHLCMVLQKRYFGKLQEKFF